MRRQALRQWVEPDTKKGPSTSPGVSEDIFEGLARGSSGLCHGARILHESSHRVTLAARGDRNSHLSTCLVCKSGRDNLQPKFSFYSHLIENYHFTAPKACWHDSGMSSMKRFREEFPGRNGESAVDCCTPPVATLHTLNAQVDSITTDPERGFA